MMIGRRGEQVVLAALAMATILAGGLVTPPGSGANRADAVRVIAEVVLVAAPALIGGAHCARTNAHSRVCVSI